MTLVRRVCLLAVVLLIAGGSSADDDANVVYVVIHDRAILESQDVDALSESLIIAPALALANQYDVTVTKPVKCKKPPCSPAEIIDQYFDYYPGKFKQSSKTLAKWLVTRNEIKGDLAVGTPIELPPVPVKIHETLDFGGTRVYNPFEQSYAFGDSPQFPDAPIVNAAPAASDDVRREADETIYRLTLEQYQQIFLTNGVAPPPDKVTVVTAPRSSSAPSGNRIAINFFDGNTPAVDYRSPFQTEWATRLQSLDSPQFRQQLSENADNARLVLIDWDFHSGHGRKVHAVAESVLANASLSFLRPDCVELNPRIEPGPLRKALDEFCTINGLQCRPEPPKKTSIHEILFSDAVEWIETYDPRPGLEQQIDEFLLKAVLWKYFREGAIMNLSFQVNNGEAPAALTQILFDSAGMAFMAAGNEPTAVRANFFPQFLARVFPGRFINVTYGGFDGTVFGSFSNTSSSERTDVTILAAGEGFVHPSFPAGTRGSSFASPSVATAAWLLRIMGGLTNETIVQELTRASRPVPLLQREIVSGGFFDPFLLLLGNGRHLVRANGTLHVVTGGTVQFDYFDPVDHSPQHRLLPLDGARQGELRVYRDGPRLMILQRERGPNPFLLKAELQRLTASISMAGEPQPLPLTETTWADGFEELSY